MGNLPEQAAGVGDVPRRRGGREGEDLGEGIMGRRGGAFEEVGMDLTKGSHVRTFFKKGIYVLIFSF